MPIDYANDWTLDTNVLIRANRCGHDPRRTNSAKRLFETIEKCAVLCWSAAVTQEYIARGAVNLKNGVPPVPVIGGINATFVDSWLTKPGVISRIKVFRARDLIRLTGGEIDNLNNANIRDRGDYPFLVLARSSVSRRLVTEEEDYNPPSVRRIRHILGVICVDDDTALEECSNSLA